MTKDKQYEGRMDVKCMCVTCHKNQQNQSNVSNKNESQLELADITGKNPPNDHYLKTSDLYRIEDIPEQFKNTEIIKGYGYKSDGYHPFYRTTNSEYGSKPPNQYTAPNCYFARKYEFSTALARSGMYRNHSLNTVMDKSHI